MEHELTNISAVEAAKLLLGCELIREFGTGTAKVRIVETEAYDESDAASHSYNGKTNRTDVMFGPAGRLYVYFTYGMHYCCNVVVGPAGYGAAVLIRAVEPIAGIEYLEENRPKPGINLTNGPAKLCQALMIDKRLNGHDLAGAPLRLCMNEPISSLSITTSRRIGISKAADMPWRFYEADSAYVSKA